MNDNEIQRQLEQAAKLSLPAGLEGRLTAALPSGIAAVQPLPNTAVRSLITLALLLLVSVGLGLATGGKGWRTLDSDQRLSLGVMLIMGGAWFAWELSLRMMPGARLYSSGGIAAGLATVATIGWAIFMTPVRGDSRLFYYVCVGYTSVGVAASFWLTRLWLRRGFITTTGFSWPTAGAAGLAGFAAVQLFCPYVDVGHIVTSHVLPAVIAGLLAARLAGSSPAPKSKGNPQ